MTRDLFPRVARRALALAALLAVFASASPLTPGAHAQQQRKKNGKPPTMGSIEISTTPGGYPIYIDGVYSGETTEYMRAFEQRPGPHKVVIVFPNGTEWKHDVNTVAGRKDCITLAYRERKPPDVLKESPCPYSVNVTATALARDGDQITFTADAGSYGGQQSDLTYTWTVEPSTFPITRGERSPVITVDSTGIGERRITATVVVEDSSGDPACRQQNRAETRFFKDPEPDTYKDDFVSVAPDFDKAHLDALVVELQRNPTYRGFLIAYGGCGPRDRSPEVLLKRAYSYITGERNIDRSRITGMLGGYRERNSYELHVRSPGLKDPTPTPTRGPCTTGRRTRR